MSYRKTRIALVAGGLVLMALGAVVLLDLVDPARFFGLALWFAGAIVVHDFLLSPLLLVAGLIGRRVGRRIGWAVLVIVQTGALVGGILTIIVLPEIVKQSIGTRNPTVLPLDYGLNLALVWGGIAVVTAIVVIVYLRVVARRGAARAA